MINDFYFVLPIYQKITKLNCNHLSDDFVLFVVVVAFVPCIISSKNLSKI